MTVQEYRELPEENKEELNRFYESFFNLIERERIESELDEETSELDKLIKRTANENNTTIS